MDKKEELFLKEIAVTYTEYLGEKLKNENESIPQTGSTDEVDKRVYEAISEDPKGKQTKRNKIVAIWTPIAAAVLLMVGLYFYQGLQKLFQGQYQEQQKDQAYQEIQEETSQILEYEMISLSAQLPSNISISDSRLDNEMTIYYLKDSYQDDVVMQLTYKKEELSTEGMTEIIVNNQSAYAVSENEYHKLVFECNGIIYELTCKYDLNTLLSVSEKIL